MESLPNLSFSVLMIKIQTPEVNNSKCKATKHDIQVHSLIDLKSLDRLFGGGSSKMKLEFFVRGRGWISCAVPEHIEMLGLHQCHSSVFPLSSRNIKESSFGQVLIDRLILCNDLEHELGVIVERIGHEDTAGKKSRKVLCEEAPVTFFGVLVPCDVKFVIIIPSGYFWN